MIVNIRGTHGSGKSTVVRAVLDRYPSRELLPEGARKPDGYEVSIPWLRKPLHVVGSYRTACGGCDSIQPYSLIWPRIEGWEKVGHVLFEGALVSSSYGNIGRALEAYGNDVVFCFMDTPLSVCLARIAARRKEKGNDKPVDPRNTEVKYNNVLKSIPKFRDEFKRRVAILDHRKPVPQLLGILLHGQ